MDLSSIISKWLEEKHPKYFITNYDSYNASIELPCGILSKKDNYYHNWWVGDVYYDRVRVGRIIGASFEYFTIHAYDPKFFNKLERHLTSHLS